MTMRKQYKREELGKGIRGKHYVDYSKSSNVVVIGPDLAAKFPTAKAVNEALRSLVQVAERVAHAPKKRGNPA